MVKHLERPGPYVKTYPPTLPPPPHLPPLTHPHSIQSEIIKKGTPSNPSHLKGVVRYREECLIKNLHAIRHLNSPRLTNEAEKKTFIQPFHHL